MDLHRGNLYRSLSFNVLHIWDQIQEREGLSLIPRIIRFAESLPTKSAEIEQNFSQTKLVKSDIRNRLHEATLEGIILISQEISDHQKIFLEKVPFKEKEPFDSIVNQIYQEQVKVVLVFNKDF